MSFLTCPPPNRFFTLVFICRRQPHLNKEEYHEHYLKVHFQHSIQMPGLVKYIQLPIRRKEDLSLGLSLPGDYDSVSVYVYESAEAYQAAMDSPAGALLQEDSVKIMDMAKNVAIPVYYGQDFHSGMNGEGGQSWMRADGSA
ncbi:uncharacterized protein I303_104954 [Kwoniella dejecticola CBS 10117]|uniref:EthD domain-containing protein n=1 Tax=Kwoniella dejecticola CBS 10117 TaxID=1296121 RepID=A0A1A6A3W1_9TREE|nr:uncharacterized protein I303_05600 [Kwoniella dejecticola CBS 10117]OBR84741.1 hypothetical protein I303_05600 [Kwoniella dejecticola CBS 10117]